MKDILYEVTNGHVSRIFTSKSSAQMWLAEEIRYAGAKYDPEALARSIVQTGKACKINNRIFSITVR